MCSIHCAGMSSTVVGVPIQGTVLIDLAVDDTEFITVSDQVCCLEWLLFFVLSVFSCHCLWVPFGLYMWCLLTELVLLCHESVCLLNHGVFWNSKWQWTVHFLLVGVCFNIYNYCITDVCSKQYLVLQMMSTLKDHKDNVGGIFNRYDILKVKPCFTA